MTDNTRSIADRSTAPRPAPAADEDRNALQRRLLLVPFCIAVFSLSALFYYHLNYDVTPIESPLQVTYSVVYRTFGFAPSFVFFLLLLIWTSIWFFAGKVERPVARILRLLATAVMLGVFLNLGDAAAGTGFVPAPHQGDLGAFLAARMVAAFGHYPSFALVFVATLGALLLATDFLFSDTFERLWARSSPGGSFGSGVGDDGVEAEVADHLKGLAAATPAFVAASSEPLPGGGAEAGGALAGAGVDPGDDEGIEAELREFLGDEGQAEADAEAAVESESEAPVRIRSRRRSYFERRREEAGRVPASDGDMAEPGAGEAVEDLPEEWIPQVQEPQDIDNPESLVSAAEEVTSDEDVDADLTLAGDDVDDAASIEDANGVASTVASESSAVAADLDEPELEEEVACFMFRPAVGPTPAPEAALFGTQRSPEDV
ncbi:MAG: hypothetical protein KDC98_04975, partial [Planctomycetes bacterium]|nr:hypothetical protein [Planctomycetota bacterium]